MATYLDHRYIYATLSGSQVDITPYAIRSDIEAEWGIEGIEKTDLLANTGILKFTLNNKGGLFNPNGVNALSGWKKGITIQLVLVYQGEAYIKFRGTLDNLEFNDEEYTVNCTVVDWMDYATKYPLVTPSTYVNKRGDEALATIISGMPIQPQSTSFDTGDSTFSIVFDSTEPKTKAYTEFSKIANSEVGSIYLRKDKTYGETLVFESRTHRSGLDTIDSFPRIMSECPRVKTSSGFVLNSTGGYIRLPETDEAFFDNTMVDITMNYGQGVVNSMSVTANPKTYDSSIRVLHSLAEPIFIGAGKTVEFYGNYIDPSGNQCNVVTGCMVQPVANTDYLCYTGKKGTGTNLTAYLSGSAVFGSAQAKFRYTNTSGRSGYITKMNARGIGIYSYSQVSALEENANSYNDYGYQTLSLEQDYQTDLVVGTELAKKIVNSEKQPKIKIVDVSFIANENPRLMSAFLNIDIGSLVHIKDDRYEIDGYFYIQKIKFSISLGGIVRFTLILRSILTLALGLTLVSCSFSGSPSTDAICYGNVESLIDLPNMSISAEIYPTNLNAGDITSGWVDDVGGFELALSSANNGQVTFIRVASGGGGSWRTTETVNQNAWNRITLTISSDLSAPQIYINGTKASVITLTPANGSYNSVNGMDFCIGNIHGQVPISNFTFPFNGKIKRVDIHNRILTSNEAIDWNNGETITDGLVFQGNCIKTSDIPIYDNATLTPELTLLDNVFGAIGVSNGSPICEIP